MPYCFIIGLIVSTQLLTQLPFIHFIFLVQGKEEQTNKQKITPVSRISDKTSLTAEKIIPVG